MSLEDIVKSLALTTLQFQQETEAGLQETRIELQEINAELHETREVIQLLGNQISQLAMTIDKIAIQSHELTSQTYANPIENVSVMTSQSGTELHMIEQAPMEAKEDEKILEYTDMQNEKVEFELISPSLSNTCVLPSAYRMSKLKEDERDTLNTSLKVKINTPVLELKALPYHLQCLYLGVSEILSNIIFQGLVKEQYELKMDEKESLRNCKEKTKRFYDFMFSKKLFEVEKKVLFYNVRLKLIPGKLSSWLGRFESVNIFLMV
ncbi:UNVERIFIED_CONTAM: hypothetical protein Sradi_7026000 [Sesamum radiatum]|uniref:Uncharacterized protein n=1 Tax=Sesamum radiatum TaxID=300843 RepID=A0AAW2JAQ1_SESRA